MNNLSRHIACELEMNQRKRCAKEIISENGFRRRAATVGFIYKLLKRMSKFNANFEVICCSASSSRPKRGKTLRQRVFSFIILPDRNSRNVNKWRAAFGKEKSTTLSIKFKSHSSKIHCVLEHETQERRMFNRKIIFPRKFLWFTKHFERISRRLVEL